MDMARMHQHTGRLPRHMEWKCHQLAGRLAVVCALLAFAFAYVWGIASFGVVAGIAFGWMPAGAAALATVFTIAAVIQPLLLHIALLQQRF